MIRRALMLLCFAASPVLAASEADRWNLADLFPSVDAWRAESTALDGDVARFGDCKGRLGESAATLAACLDRQALLWKRYARLYVYASELLAEDTGVAASAELKQRIDLVGSRLEEATAFVDPEILAIGRERVDAFLRQQPSLAAHRHPLDDVLRRAPHTLDPAGEALVAAFGPLNNAGRNVYGILTNADVPWPTLTLSGGEQATIDPTGYGKYRDVASRDDRKRVMDAFFATFRTYERTTGVTLYTQMQQDAVQAKVRRYPDSISRALDRDRMPVAVMDTLIRETNASLPTLHRYFRLRAKLLGLPSLAYYDIYPPIVHGDFRFPYERARELVVQSAAPLGTAYVDAYRTGLSSRWMDVYPRPRKQSGAHMAGYAYDVHPYVLMNYTDDYESVSTVAHEWGHAMHSYLASRAQPFVTANYATFVAEIASTMNEHLLLDHMLKQAKGDDERLFYLGHALEAIRGTFYRQAMFAEFERVAHARVDAGEPMSGAQYTKLYCDLMKRYHGAAEGVVAIDDAYCVEWAYIPHFYTSFYVYQYATSVAASALFAKRVLAGEPGALDRYLDLLRAGGSDYAYDLVKSAGVDLATPEPYRALVAQMNAIMDEIEAILARRKT